ncbi:hypothetical protein LTR78_004025 [Recurvomyces mirabilis]|uniref:CBM21 domain-containing protein n=1 Tax=Recurvomyces mirabilis TaxID=574656 RepID=A0AAE1C359_9PEZI|nr:hypothetical protein LTR78_004025 [Recurvomyces mirabilis]KAK5153837.1 hypothetical protein LTS14_007056 [Recurvomyces mirabilis]
MPYTPPTQQSPASSKSSTPAVSRSASYSEDVPRSPVTSRPQPPRSNSASYLHKHRRSPSLSVSEVAAPPTPTEVSSAKIEAVDFARNSSVRQSPPPINNLRIPTGMVLSPPESPENSDGDEAATEERGREDQRWDQLREAVRTINQRREGSPDRTVVIAQETKSEPHSQSISPSALSREARKISHSRSSTETAIVIPKVTSFESPATTSDDSDDDQGPLSKPSLVRKKSGELVKPALRPSSRRRYSSMPGTPTYHKSVHFNEADNQTRHFLKVDKPMAVSAGSSPVESYESESEFPFEGDSKPELDIKLANFPADTFERKAQPVRVERIFLSQDKKTLIGSIAVQNISFHKLVVARFTLDHWTTTSEIVAEFNNDPRSPPTDACDRFNFHIKLSDSANIDTKTLFLCVRYTVNGQDYWDSNNGANYQVDFTKLLKMPTKPNMTVSTLGARPRSAIPRSRHSGPNSPRGRQESVDDDFVSRLDSNSAYHFGNTESLLGEGQGSIKLKPRTKRGSLFPTTQTNGLGGRYDFGASLSAALSTAQDKLGRQSGLMNTAKPSDAGGSYFAPLERTEVPHKVDQRPDSLSTDRPAMGSDQYRDLVQKFCYFTPGAGKPAGSPPNPSTAVAARNDSVTETTSLPTSSRSSGSSTPSHQLDGSTDQISATLSAFASRSASPTPITGHVLGNRAASPMSFGYPYLSNTRDGYLSDSRTLTAIQG